MKKVFMVVAGLIILAGIGFLILKPTQVNVSQAASAGEVSQNAYSADKVESIVINSYWVIGLAQWNRTLQLSDCKKGQCSGKIIFSTPQICPEGTADDEWCDEIQLSGKIQFVDGGFHFTDDQKSSTTVFCQLKHDGGEESWRLAGDACPAEFAELYGSAR